MTKAFALAAKSAVVDEVQAMDFTIDGTEETLYIYPPKNAQLALIMSSMSDDAEGTEGIATFMSTFFGLLDEDSRPIIRRRLKDRQDPFDIPDVMEIIKWVISEAAERPTQSSSASTPSRTPTGSPSRAGARRVVSASSTSAPAEPAT